MIMTRQIGPDNQEGGEKHFTIMAQMQKVALTLQFLG